MGCGDVQAFLIVLGKEYKMGREIIVLGVDASTSLLLLLV